MTRWSWVYRQVLLRYITRFARSHMVAPSLFFLQTRACIYLMLCPFSVIRNCLPIRDCIANIIFPISLSLFIYCNILYKYIYIQFKRINVPLSNSFTTYFLFSKLKENQQRIRIRYAFLFSKTVFENKPSKYLVSEQVQKFLSFFVVALSKT